MKALGIIGFGNMGEAFVQGIRKNIPAIRVNFIERSKERRTLARDSYQAQDCDGDYARVLADSDITILAIKPQDIATLMSAIKPYSADKRLVSIIAGRSLDYYLKNSESREIARFMPNLAAAVGKSVTGVSFSPESSPAFVKDAMEIAACIGSAMEIPEKLMPAIVGVSGSGIAFVFQFLHAMSLGGTKAGFSYKDSLSMSMDVLEGAVASLRANGLNPVEMLSRVCSAAGTTIEGVLALERGGLNATVADAISQTVRRAAELET